MSGDSTKQCRYGTDADWDVIDGVHIGATWRIRWNVRVLRRCGLMSHYFDHVYCCCM